MSQKDHWWLFHIHTKKNIVFRKNGWEGTVPDVTQGSEFNNDKDPKKVLDTQAETKGIIWTWHVMDSAQLHM